MRLNLYDLETYSMCPRYYSLNKGPRQEDTPIPSKWNIVYQAYHYRSLYEKDMPWPKIRRAVGRLLYEAEHNKVPLKTEQVLVRYMKWYDAYYKKDTRAGVANLQATIRVGPATISHSIPLVLLDSPGRPPGLLFVCDEHPEAEEFYNSFYYRGLLWLASEYLGSEITQAHFINISSAISVNQTFTVHKGHDSMKAMIGDIVVSINEKRNWPAQGPKCTGCKFYDKECVL